MPEPLLEAAAVFTQNFIWFLALPYMLGQTIHCMIEMRGRAYLWIGFMLVSGFISLLLFSFIVLVTADVAVLLSLQGGMLITFIAQAVLWTRLLKSASSEVPVSAKRLDIADRPGFYMLRKHQKTHWKTVANVASKTSIVLAIASLLSGLIFGIFALAKHFDWQ